jgi:regulator of extracellular matrix RemA (YlzA/DUF370 family)
VLQSALKRFRANVIFADVESGANPANSLSVAEQMAFNNATSTLAAAIAPKPQLAPIDPKVKRSHKKVEAKVEVTYGKDQERWIVVCATHLILSPL